MAADGEPPKRFSNVNPAAISLVARMAQRVAEVTTARSGPVDVVILAYSSRKL
jgi:hypothetical protein